MRKGVGWKAAITALDCSALESECSCRQRIERIPRVIHYCWFGGKPLPYEVRKCIRSWEEFCPDYDIVRWDEGNFDVESHPFCKAAYKAKAWAFVSDYARLKVVLDHGGIYLDTDVEVLRSLDDLLENQCYIGVQQGGHLCNTGLGFGSVEGGPVVREMLERYDDLAFTWDSAKKLACPALNDRVVRSYGYKGDGMGAIERLGEVAVYPCRYFDPLAPGESQNLLCCDTYSIHHYGNSWGSTKDALKRKLIRLVGTERIAEIKEVLRA